MPGHSNAPMSNTTVRSSPGHTAQTGTESASPATPIAVAIFNPLRNTVGVSPRPLAICWIQPAEKLPATPAPSSAIRTAVA